jgi:hypothetical protein
VSAAPASVGVPPGCPPMPVQPSTVSVVAHSSVVVRPCPPLRDVQPVVASNPPMVAHDSGVVPARTAPPVKHVEPLMAFSTAFPTAPVSVVAQPSAFPPRTPQRDVQPVAVPVSPPTPVSAERKTRRKLCQTFLDQVGEVFAWKEMLRRLGEGGEANETERGKAFFQAITELDVSNDKRRRKVVPILVRILLTEIQDNAELSVALNVLHGTARQLIQTIKSEYGVVIKLPTKKRMDQIRDVLRLEFMMKWKLSITPTGMRINLVSAVKYVANVVYGLLTLEDVRVDLWGDGMVRGKQSITRLCFRIIGCKNPSVEFKTQSRHEVYAFAVFYGKDDRENLEKNCGSFGMAGGQGWFFIESKQLVEEEKVILTLTGDMPFMYKLVLGTDEGNDFSSKSKAAMWIPDPPQVNEKTAAVVAKYENMLEKDVGVVRDLGAQYLPKVVQDELTKVGVILPNVSKDGFRTKVVLNLEQPMPESSLVYLRSRAYISLDFLHGSIRISEKDLKLIVELLLTSFRYEHFKEFERNLNNRAVNSQQFAFTFAGTLANATTVDDIKLCGEDSRVIIATLKDLKGSDVTCDLLEGVFCRKKICLNNNAVSTDIIMMLHAGTDIIQELGMTPVFSQGEVGPEGPPEGGVPPGVWGLSERTVGDLLFYAHNEISKFCRDPTKTVKDVKILEKWIDTYYHCNMLLFPIQRAFTPYKAKLLILPQLLRTGKIICLFDHLTEGLENSNHGVNGLFHNHSLRNGGHYEWHTTAEFDDIFFGFINCIKAGFQRVGSAQLEVGFSFLSKKAIDDVVTGNSRKTYLTICRNPLPEMALNLDRTDFRGMRFSIIGPFTTVNPFRLKTGKMSGRITKEKLVKVVEDLRGSVVSDSAEKTLSEKHSALNCSYVVIQNDVMLNHYVNRTRDIVIPPRLVVTTRGDWTYIRAQYVIDCYVQNKLLDPNGGYTIDVDRSKFVRPKRAPTMPRHTVRQREPVAPVQVGPDGQPVENVPQQLLAKTALKRNRSKSRVGAPTCGTLNQAKTWDDNSTITAAEKRKIRDTQKRNKKRRSVIYNTSTSVKRRALYLFQQDYADSQKRFYTEEKMINGKLTDIVDVSRLNKASCQYWKNDADQSHWQEVAMSLAGEWCFTVEHRPLVIPDPIQVVPTSPLVSSSGSDSDSSNYSDIDDGY